MAGLRSRAYLARVVQEHRGEIDALLRGRDLPVRVRARAEMVKALALGHPVTGIVAWSGCSARTVKHWLERFATDGLAGLLDAPRKGLPFDGWTSPRLSAYLAEQTGVRLAPGWLRVVLQYRDYTHG
jgi:transposase